MRTCDLRAFIPTAGASVFDTAGNKFRLTGRDPIFDVHGCRSTLNFKLPGQKLTRGGRHVYLRDEELRFSVTSVEAGETIILRRPGRPDFAETFPQAGIVLDAPILESPENLQALRDRPIKLDIDFRPEQFDERGVAVARVAGVRLAGPGERGDCQLRLIK